ncbi:MAG: hypothetical protein ACYC7D_05945 [Nitrososphaerales archaeon]
MTLAPQVEELRESEDGVLIDGAALKVSSNGAKRNPPARNTSRFWFERFLAIIQRQNPSVIDGSFLSQIAPSNEGKLLSQLKFLKVIDEQGKPTSLLPLLNLVGEEQKKGFQQMVAQSYSDLLAEVKIEKAVADDLVNFFIRKYAFTRDKAVNASKFFLYIADKGSIQLSPELATFLSEKNSNGTAVQGTSSPTAPRIIERSARMSFRAPANSQKAPRRPLLDDSQAVIHANIEIKLDKDTPKEYWDRVLALLGERKVTEDQPSEIVSEENKAQQSQE